MPMILVAVDHTVEALFAMRLCSQLTRGTDVQLEAFHVLEPSNRVMDYGAGWAIHTRKQEQIDEAREDLEAIVATESEPCDQNHQLKVVLGNAVKEITNQAQQTKCDALFMGSVHPLEGANKGILLKVLAHIQCPLVVVKRYRDPQKVLLCLQDLEADARAIAAAKLLLAKTQAQIEIVNAAAVTKDHLEKARETLAEAGLQAVIREISGDHLKEIAHLAPEYDLAVAPVDHNHQPGALVMRLVPAIKTAAIICP